MKTILFRRPRIHGRSGQAWVITGRIALFMLTCLSVFSVKSQDAEFSQFFANPLYLNPALAGAENYNRAVINYRNQWPGLDKGFITYNASYDQYISKLRGGIGVLVNVDNAGAGILKTTQASLIYSYSVRITYKFFMNMALQGTFFQRSFDWDRLTFGDQFDPFRGLIGPTDEVPPQSASVIVPDFSAGLAFGWKSVIHGGIAVHHLTEPNLAFYSQYKSQMPLKVTGHLGVNIDLTHEGGMDFNPEFYISPNILYQQQGNFHQVNAGVYIVRLPLVIGTWYRHNFENPDAFIVLVGITYDKLRFGYSYDITLSQIRDRTGGAHEVSVAYLFRESRLRRIYPLSAPGF